MSLSENLSFSPAEFSGRIRLFPLPNLVVFPHVMQPLHIFEPRYRAMLEEALAGDRLIGMVLLAPGWEKDYDGRPPLRSVGCLCRVATYHRTDDGSYNVLILGLRRIVIERELPPDKLFRVAEGGSARMIMRSPRGAAARPATAADGGLQVHPAENSRSARAVGRFARQPGSFGHAHRYRRLHPGYRPGLQGAAACRNVRRSAGRIAARASRPLAQGDLPPRIQRELRSP